jgi:DNA-binding winged helix-turn-helix (wHTH) protein
MEPTPGPELLVFGEFELDPEAEELRRKGKRVKLPPQPFKLLTLLATHAGRPVGRDEIRRHLWPEGTFVDFEQGVNFCVKQIREALSDTAGHSVYIETIPRKGYRFRVPVAVHRQASPGAISDSTTTMRLQKVLWANIAELRLAEERRKRLMWIGLGILGAVILVLIGLIVRLR